MGLLRAPAFSLSGWVIEGNSRLSEGEILQAAGLSAGASLFALDLDELRARLEADPRIAEARLRRRLAGLLEIHVVERRPVARVQTQEGEYLFAADGWPLWPADDDDGAVPRVSGGWDEPESADRAADPRLLRALEAAEFWDGYLGGRLAHIEMTPQFGSVLQTRDGLRILLGDDGDTAEKARVLAGLLERIEGGARLREGVIDVRLPSRPVWR